MTQNLPRRSQEYRNHLFESQNWDLVIPRDGDVVITGSCDICISAAQNIVLQMIYRGELVPAAADVSPWVDQRRDDPVPMAEMLAVQRHRRVMKSRLPLDAIPFHQGTRYIVCVRDARDVFMSLWNQLSQMPQAIIDLIRGSAARSGEPMPGVGTDLHAFWASWINRGRFPWETEGYPHSANMGHTQSWWSFRHLPNVLFVHHSDILDKPVEEVHRMARHLGIVLADDAVDGIVEMTTFMALCDNAVKSGHMPVAAASADYPKAISIFYFEGTNGRWRDVLTAEELAMYEAAKRRVLSPDCAAYCEGGRAAVSETSAARAKSA